MNWYNQTGELCWPRARAGKCPYFRHLTRALEPSLTVPQEEAPEPPQVPTVTRSAVKVARSVIRLPAHIWRKSVAAWHPTDGSPSQVREEEGGVTGLWWKNLETPVLEKKSWLYYLDTKWNDPWGLVATRFESHLLLPQYLLKLCGLENHDKGNWLLLNLWVKLTWILGVYIFLPPGAGLPSP